MEVEGTDNAVELTFTEIPVLAPVPRVRVVELRLPGSRGVSVMEKGPVDDALVKGPPIEALMGVDVALNTGEITPDAPVDKLTAVVPEIV